MIPCGKKNKTDIEHEFLRFSDLNSFVTFITRFYSFVFDQLKQRYPKCRLNSWVDCFITSSELSKKGDHSLRDAIADIMKHEAGITAKDWEQLQEIRRIRNSACHPNGSVTRAREALRDRWDGHPAKEAISKMLNLSERISTPPRSTPREVPLKNWRERNRRMSKMGLRKRFS